MIEEATFLIVSKKERGLAPNIRIGHQDVEKLRQVPCPEVRYPVRMFGIGFRRHNPRHLWQSVLSNVVAKDVQKPEWIPVVGQNICSCLGLVGKRRAEECILILMEIEKRVVAVIAGV